MIPDVALAAAPSSIYSKPNQTIYWTVLHCTVCTFLSRNIHSLPSRVAGAAVVEEDGAGVDGRADGAQGDVPAHFSAHLVHRVDVERHRVLCRDREFITLISVLSTHIPGFRVK